MFGGSVKVLRFRGSVGFRFELILGLPQKISSNQFPSSLNQASLKKRLDTLNTLIPTPYTSA